MVVALVRFLFLFVFVVWLFKYGCLFNVGSPFACFVVWLFKCLCFLFAFFFCLICVLAIQMCVHYFEVCSIFVLWSGYLFGTIVLTCFLCWFVIVFWSFICVYCFELVSRFVFVWSVCLFTFNDLIWLLFVCFCAVVIHVRSMF